MEEEEEEVEEEEEEEEEDEEGAASSEGVVSLSAMQVLCIEARDHEKGDDSREDGGAGQETRTSSSLTTPRMELPDARNLRLSWAADAAMATRAARSLRAEATRS